MLRIVDTNPLDTQQHSENAVKLAQKFSKRIVGQEAATNALINVLDKFDSGFYDHTRPIASVLFLGPTGTGKTATVEAVAEGLFGSVYNMFKIDCGEFQHSHDIAKLIGSPPGYLGHRETHAVITNEKIKQMQLGNLPLSIILFDEIEKASDGLWNLLLGILDKGSLTLGTNEVVDLRSTIILMTSNIGSKELAAKAGNDVLGFLAPSVDDAVSVNELRDIAVAAAKRKFTPEFLNRLDEIVMFNTLTEDNLREILEIEINKLQTLILAYSDAKPILVISPAAKRHILQDGYDKKYGARYLKRHLEKVVIQPLSRVLASKQVCSMDTVVVDWQESDYTYHVVHNAETNRWAG